MLCPKCNSFNIKVVLFDNLTDDKQRKDVIKNFLFLENIVVSAIRNDIPAYKSVNWACKNIDHCLLPNPIANCKFLCVQCGHKNDPNDFLDEEVKKYMDWYANSEQMIEALE